MPLKFLFQMFVYFIPVSKSKYIGTFCMNLFPFIYPHYPSHIPLISLLVSIFTTIIFFLSFAHQLSNFKEVLSSSSNALTRRYFSAPLFQAPIYYFILYDTPQLFFSIHLTSKPMFSWLALSVIKVLHFIILTHWHFLKVNLALNFKCSWWIVWASQYLYFFHWHIFVITYSLSTKLLTILFFLHIRRAIPSLPLLIVGYLSLCFI